MGILHFEDLTIKDALSALNLDWEMTEKIDGSYFEFGLDDNGQFFAKRKGGKACYQVSDWERACWTTAFIMAHRAAENFIDCLEAESLIEPGDVFKSEILMGNMHNTVQYVHVPSNEDGTIFITGYPSRINDKSWMVDGVDRVTDKFSANFSQRALSSEDGVVIEESVYFANWWIQPSTIVYERTVQSALSKYAEPYKTLLSTWSSAESAVEGFSNRECLEVNLNSKSPKCGDRKWSELKTALKTEREKLRKQLTDFLLLFKEFIIRSFFGMIPNNRFNLGSQCEGLVVKVVSNGLLFKVTQRESFSEANLFTHIVKYWLIGGRRPNRPSFLSRTKNWSIEDRLARLEVLRIRYLSNRHCLKSRGLIGSKTGRISYNGDLHTRTLNLFADTRQRILDGR